MEFIKEILIDALNGFSLKLIPLFLFQLLSAALMGHLLHLVLRKKFSVNDYSNFVLTAALVCVLAAISKYSLPFSILAAATIILLMRNSAKNKMDTLFTVFVVTIGVGCGVGSVVQTFLGFAVLLVILLFLPVEKE